jgi:hypothetical protein
MYGLNRVIKLDKILYEVDSVQFFLVPNIINEFTDLRSIGGKARRKENTI